VRFPRQRSGFVLGYKGEIAVTDDHLIVAQRVTQNQTDNGSLLPMAARVVERCGQPPGQLLADSGILSKANLEQLETQTIDGYIPDSDLNFIAATNSKFDSYCYGHSQENLRTSSEVTRVARAHSYLLLVARKLGSG
jgi:hypothetical protein